MQTGPTLPCPSLVYSDHCTEYRGPCNGCPLWPPMAATASKSQHRIPLHAQANANSPLGLPWRFPNGLYVHVAVDWTTLRCKLYFEGYFNKDKPINVTIHIIIENWLPAYRNWGYWVERCIGGCNRSIEPSLSPNATGAAQVRSSIWSTAYTHWVSIHQCWASLMKANV